jgi:hypothetical protein
MLSAQARRTEAGDPTPYMGLLEGIGIGARLLWMAVAALLLLPRNRGLKHSTNAGANRS